MLLIFIDETGTASRKDPNPWYGMCASIVKKEAIPQVNLKIGELISKYSTKYNCKFEIHAREFSNTKDYPYNSMTTDERMDIFKDCLTVISKLPIKICAAFINKANYHYWKGEFDYLNKVVMNLFERLILNQKHYNTSQESLIFYDQPSEDMQKIVRENFIGFLKQGTYYLYSPYFVKDVIYITSKLHYAIQISDLCGYVLRRYINYKLKPSTSVYDNHAVEFYEIIKPIIDTNLAGEIYGSGVKIIGDPVIEF